MNELFLYWDRDFFKFDKEVWGKCPYKLISDDENEEDVILYDATGISRENIIVDIKSSNQSHYLTISGKEKNKYTDYEYSISGRFRIKPDSIDNIDVTLENGILYVRLKRKKIEKPNLNINWLK